MEHTGPLSEVFLSQTEGKGGRAPADLEDRLQRLLDRCREVWPDLAVPTAAFLQHVARQVAGREIEPDGELADRIDALHAEDLYLAWACARGLPAAHAAFDRVYLGQVPAWLSRDARMVPLAEEVQQVLRERLLVAGSREEPRIAGYGGKGKLLSFVRIAAMRVVADLRRGAGVQRTESWEPAALEQLGDQITSLRNWTS